MSESLNRLEFRVCFAAGTPLRTPEGSKAIESFRAGDLVLSRDENNTGGLVVAKVFVREGLVSHLHVKGSFSRDKPKPPHSQSQERGVDRRMGDTQRWRGFTFSYMSRTSCSSSSRNSVLAISRT